MDTIAELIACTFRVHQGANIQVKSIPGDSVFREYVPPIVFDKLDLEEWDTKIGLGYKKIATKNDVETRAHFLDILKGWDLFGSSFFGISGSNDARFAQGGLLCVDGVGIRVLDWETRVHLFFDYFPNVHENLFISSFL